MELDLSPKLVKQVYGGNGSGTARIVLPEAEEKVVAIKKGDALALPSGGTDTSKTHKASEFTDFFLTGTNAIFTGFSTEFVGRAWDFEEHVVKTLVGKQSGNGIVKLGDMAKLPEPKEEHRQQMALNYEEAPLDVVIKNGGRVVVLNTQNLPLVGEIGLGADLVRLDGSAICSPRFSYDSALQVTYVVRGSLRVQVVGVDGRKVLETKIKAGNLFIVPRFFVVSKIDEPEGLNYPIFTHLAGRTSVCKALSPQVLEASFNASPELEQLFCSKKTAAEIFLPPPN
ncbi:11-S seed storage protein [Parasponia andersonii]|uniref:11-S seed storage protein n=1 Tax=Parasponia andersonii TaxID=3476 RepID=A0A2P5AIS8_PARAD|nr:11-S seed storage protein [Parasponia andersonii]